MKLGRKLRQKSLEAEKAAMEKRIKEELDAVTTTEEAIALQRSPTHTDADKARAQPPCSSAHFNRTTVRIGKGGDTIKAISSETGARVDIAREGNDKGAIQISGTPEQIRAAKKMIQAALKPADITAVAVGADKLSFVIGSCSCPPARPQLKHEHAHA